MIIGYVFLVIGAIGFIALSAILNGLAFSYAWNMIIPQLFLLPELSVVQAIAITVFVSYLTYTPQEQQEASDEHKQEQVKRALMMVIIRPVVIISAAFILGCFI